MLNLARKGVRKLGQEASENQVSLLVLVVWPRCVVGARVPLVVLLGKLVQLLAGGLLVLEGAQLLPDSLVRNIE